MNFDNFKKFIKPYFWRLVFIILGFVTAISFLVLGFGKTMVILLCCVIGYLIGLVHDKDIRLLEWLQHWRDKWY